MKNQGLEVREGGTCLELPPLLTELEDPRQGLVSTKITAYQMSDKCQTNTNITAYKILLRKTLHS